MFKKIGILEIFSAFVFLLLLIFNINYYRSEKFKIQAFGESHYGVIIAIDSSKANYQNYNFIYNINLDNSEKRIKINKIERRSLRHINDKVEIKFLDGKSDFTFSIEDISFMFFFGLILILSGLFFLKVYRSN